MEYDYVEHETFPINEWENNLGTVKFVSVPHVGKTYRGDRASRNETYSWRLIPGTFEDAKANYRAPLLMELTESFEHLTKPGLYRLAAPKPRRPSQGHIEVVQHTNPDGTTGYKSTRYPATVTGVAAKHLPNPPKEDHGPRN